MPRNEKPDALVYSSDSGSEYADSAAEQSDDDLASVGMLEPQELYDLHADGEECDLTQGHGDSGPVSKPITFDPSQVEGATAPQDEDALEELIEDIHQFELDNPEPTQTADGPGSDGEQAVFDGNRAPREVYLASMRNFNRDNFKRKHYSKGTLKLIKNSENYWRLFCVKILRNPDSEACCRAINFMTIYHFLWWYLNQRTGVDGRAKRPVRAMGSLVTFWCSFRLFYRTVVLESIGKKLEPDEMHNALVTLGKKFNLTYQKRENRPMTLEDLKRQVEKTLSTTEVDFKLGEVRILAVLFLLLMAPAGSRPQSILDIRFKDIDILLIRDPVDPSGPPRLTIRLRLEHTKQYGHTKAIKTFLVPEILFDPSLFLSPHVFLLAILFKNRVFLADGLNDNPSSINTLKIHPESQELRLYFKERFNDMYLFRRAQNSLLGGYRMSETSPITQGMTGNWLTSVGRQLGFKDKTYAYTLRYGAGNALDQSGTISDALRNLVLDHAPNSDTFQRHYLNRNVCADLWAIARAHEPQQALINQSASHGGSRDSRRSFRLTREQIEEVKRDERYVQMTRQLENPSLGRRSEVRKRITKERKRLVRQLKAKKLKQAVEEWTNKQALEDIELQIRGEEFPNVRDKQPVDSQQDRTVQQQDRTIQQQMLEALTAPLVGDMEAQFRRRTDAILALVAYAGDEEPLVTKVLEARRPPPPIETTLSLSVTEEIIRIRNSVFVSVMGRLKVRRCFLCVVKACNLGKAHPRFDDLCRDFYDTNSLARHFTSCHLDALPESRQELVGPLECPCCCTPLYDKTHLRLHADDVHGIITAKRPMRHVRHAGDIPRTPH